MGRCRRPKAWEDVVSVGKYFHIRMERDSVAEARHGSPYSSTMALNVQSNPLTGPSPLRDIVRPQFHQNNFAQELFIKNELGLKLDKGMGTRVFHP